MNRPDPADDLSAGTETGWCNEDGTPAPGPTTSPRTGGPRPTTSTPNPDNHPSRQPPEESPDYTTSRDLTAVSAGLLGVDAAGVARDHWSSHRSVAMGQTEVVLSRSARFC